MITSGSPRTLLLLSAVAAASAPSCLPVAKAPSQVAKTHLGAGARQLQAGHLDQAEAHFAVAAEYSPRAAQAYNGLGLVALARGERGRAAALFQRAVHLDGDLAEARNNLGVLWLSRGRAAEAAGHFRAALDVDPGYHQARFNLSRALHEMGDLPGARQELLKVTAVRPQDAAVWSALALINVDLGLRAAAGEAIRRAAALRPGSPEALVAQGALARANGDLASALRAHEEARRLDPGDLSLRMQLGLTLLASGRDAEARREFGRVLAGRPFSARAHFAMGVLAARRMDLQSAAKAFGRTRELEPAFHAAYLQEAAAHLGLGRLGPARAACQALRASPGRPQELLKRCKALLASPGLRSGKS
ncbi:MAG: tetratricopeptide repeat protein [Polyangia bacterium]|jgi:tetratricopeptide (TPR) repeat protein|nr:tetratricopeptide repeat protein [Polyangia bacterium]